MSFDTPAPFYDRFNPLTTKWFRLLFVPGVDLQAAEMNEVQSLIQNQVSKLGGGIFKNGTFLKGGETAVTITEDGALVTINAGSLWADAVHDVPAASVEITGQGTETIYLKITETVLTAQDDPTLLDPAEGAENFGYEGARRLLLNYEYVLGTNTGIPIVTLINGQIVQNSSTNGFLDQLYKILAIRTREQFGQFVADRPKLSFADTADLSTNPTQLVLYVDKGIFYNQGYRFENTDRKVLSVLRPLTGQSTLNEPHTFISGTKVYELADGPVLGVTQLDAVIQSPTISMGRGLTLNGQDDIPAQYRPVQSVISAVQGSTTYIQGTDFTRSNYTITWLPGGSQPSPGTTYSLVVNYEKILTQAVRTLTSVSAENKTIAASGTTDLAHIDIAKLTSVVNTTTSTTLVEGTDFTLNYGTGSITWLSGYRPATGNVVAVTYTYWAHTTEGDFVSRDSFIDVSGNKLLYGLPTKTPSGITVDYLKDISFDVTGGKTPVASQDFRTDYSYALGRVDTLVCNMDGILEIVKGEPSLTPQPPADDDRYVPIAKLHLGPEVVASEVQLEWYNNLIMKVLEQRQLHQQVQDIQYNTGVNQLLQNAQNIQTDTPKKGIFTDAFVNPVNVDTGHSLYAGTFDFLSKRYLLPRNVGKTAPTVSSNTGATLKQDIWMLAYSEDVALSQSIKSRAETVNEYGAVNRKAKVVTNPAISLANDNSLSITVNIHFPSGALDYVTFPTAHALLMAEVSPGSSAAASYGTAETLVDDLLNKIGTDPSWSQQGNYSTTTNNIWAKVLSELEVVANPAIVPRNITVTGSGFRVNDRAIQCFLDGKLLAITATGATVQETDPGYPGTVRANNLGTWTGTITTPADVPLGAHTLIFMSHDVADLGRVSSLASASFTTGGISTQAKLTVTLSRELGAVPCNLMPGLTLAAVLGYGGTQDLLAAANSPSAHSIAYAIEGALKAGLTVDKNTLAAGIFSYYAIFVYVFSNIVTPQIALNIANVCNTTTVGNVANNIAAINNLLNNTGLYYGPYLANLAPGPNSRCTIDPLAQTFSFPQKKFMTYVNIYAATLPSEDVAVAISTVENGQPTGKYLAIAYKAAADITSTTGATKFTFDKPVFIDENKDYAIVVLTQDPNFAVWTAAVGDKDVPGNNLILVNPSSGVLLKSTDAKSWTVLQGHSLKFDIGCAAFTSTEAYLNFGKISFGAQNSSIIAFYMPFVETTQETKVIYQYSKDNVSWQDFSPLKDQELGSIEDGIYLRIKMLGTADISPTVANYAVMQFMIYQSSGNYVSKTFATATATARYAEIYSLNVIPGNTTLPHYVSYDNGATWNLMTEVTADAVNIDNTIFQRHYIHDSGAANKQYIKFRVGLNSTVSARTPELGDLIGWAR